MIKFSRDKVLLLHQLITQETGGSREIRDIALLGSALELSLIHIFIVWITDNTTRPDEDKTMLVSSVFENGVWSAPQAVYDDGLADYSPVMKDGYSVWQKATDHISADMTSRELGEICEIELAKWNGSSFDEPIPVSYTHLDVYKRQQ